MRIGHASISENGDSGRNGKAKAGNQNGRELCIRNFYSKPWKYLLRCKDSVKAEQMAKACESMTQNPCIGYDQTQRNTLNIALKKIGYDYSKLNELCECDCSSFMTVCAQCAGINIPYSNGNAPTTTTMVNAFKSTGMFEVLTEGINEEYNLRRGDILVGPPASHTVMVLDNGSGVPLHITTRRTLKKGMKGSDVLYMQKILQKLGYDLGKSGADADFGPATASALLAFQKEHFIDKKDWDSICGKRTWMMLENYA